MELRILDGKEDLKWLPRLSDLASVKVGGIREWGKDAWTGMRNVVWVVLSIKLYIYI